MMMNQHENQMVGICLGVVEGKERDLGWEIFMIWALDYSSRIFMTFKHFLLI